MSLLWKTAVAPATPWDHESDDEDLHDGVEDYGGMEVAHPDDTPYHDEPLMNTTELRHERVDPHTPVTGMQAWLSKPILDHFAQEPRRMYDPSIEPVHLIHDEDTGERYLLNGHHRFVVARALGLHRTMDAEVSYVSRKRLR